MVMAPDDERLLPAGAVDGLIEALAHGDDEHRAWLAEAIRAHFSGKPIPEMRGQGLKEARIAELEAENAKLRILARRAYREGWEVNAIPAEEHDAGADYVRGCEEVDWLTSKAREELAG